MATATPKLTIKQLEQALSTAQLASLLATSTQVVRRSRVDGELFGIASPPFFRLGRCKVFYLRADIEEYLAHAQRQQISQGYSTEKE